MPQDQLSLQSFPTPELPDGAAAEVGRGAMGVAWRELVCLPRAVDVVLPRAVEVVRGLEVEVVGRRVAVLVGRRAEVVVVRARGEEVALGELVGLGATVEVGASSSP